MLHITPKLRKRLKSPLGQLIKGPRDVIIEELQKKINRTRPKIIICVGDAVSRLFTENNLRSDVQIIDNMEMRHSLEPKKLNKSRKIFFTSNKAGTIEICSWQAIAEAIKVGNSIVVVRGEEDLLALAALSLAPLDSFVIYGQPKMGVVLVKADDKLKAEVNTILNSMQKVEFHNETSPRPRKNRIFS